MDARTRELWSINKYLWLCLAFLGFLLPLAGAQGWLGAPTPVLWALYGVALLNAGLRTYSGWRRRGEPARLAWVFTLADIALISVAVRLTHGVDSELWLIYIILVVAESMFAGTVSAAAVMGFVSVGYLAGTWESAGRPDYVLTVGTRLFFASVAGAFARRIGADRLKRAAELAALREEVATQTERSRIAREVHDSLGHAMVASILRLELATRLLRRDIDEAERILAEEPSALRAAWNEGRDLAFSTQPVGPDDSDLGATLRRLAAHFAERTGLAIEVDCPAGVNGGAAAGRVLVRIVQEALTNVARHARASRVSVGVQCVAGQVECDIQDDGVGLPSGGRPASNGVEGMRTRAAEIGGSFVLENGPAGGAVVRVRLPAETGKDGAGS